MTRRIFFWGGLVVGTLVFGFALLVAAISLGWQRDRLRTELEIRLADALGEPVVIESLEGALHRGVEASGVRIGGGEAPLLSLETILVEWGGVQWGDPPTLLIRNIEVSGLQLDLRRGADERWPWQGLGGDEENAPPSIAVAVAQIRLGRSAIVLRQPVDLPLFVELEAQIREVTTASGFSIAKAEAAFGVSRAPGQEAAWTRGTLVAGGSPADWRLDNLEIKGPHLVVDGAASGGLEGLEGATLRAEIASLVELGRLLTGEPLLVSGSARFHADVSGPYSWPLGRVTAEATDLKTAELALGGFRLEGVSPKAGALRIEALEISSNEIGLRAEPGGRFEAGESATTLSGMRFRGEGGQGLVVLDATASRRALWDGDPLRNPRTELRLRVENWSLEVLQPIWQTFGAEIAGRLDASLTLLGAPAGAQINGALQSRHARVKTPSAVVEDLSLELEVGGTLATPTGSLTARAGRLAWQEKSLGALDLDLRSSDGVTLAIKRFALGGGPLPLNVQAGASLRREEGGVAIEHLNLESGSQRVGVTGRISSTRLDRLQLELVSIDVAEGIRAARAFGLAVSEMPASGRLGGALVVDGPLTRPGINGELTLTDASLSEFAFERVVIQLQTAADLLSGHSRWTQEGRDVLTIDARLPSLQLFAAPAGLFEEPRTTVRIRADAFELGALNVFLPATVAKVGGRLDADVDLRGNAVEPALAGTMTVRDGVAELPGLGGMSLASIAGKLRLENRRVELEDLRVGEEGAGFRGSGRLEMVSGKPEAIALRVAFEGFPIAVPGLVVGVLDGPVEISGTAAAPVLRGVLTLDGLHIQIPEPDDPEFKEIRVLTADQGKPELKEGTGTSLLDPLQMDLQLNVTRNSWARGRGADVELRGDLNAKKEPREALLLSGTLETVRGSYELYARRFRIERGRVTLDGAAEVDPVLEVRAEHRVRDVQIFVVIEGRLSDPQIRFESRPELSETDIASYLILGRSAEEAGSGDQPALEAAAAQIAAGAALREIELLFGGRLPVDLVDVRMEGEGEDSEIRGGFGKYIGERLFLYYERGFGDEPEDELKAELEVTPRWSVESTVSSEGETGADLILEIGD